MTNGMYLVLHTLLLNFGPLLLLHLQHLIYVFPAGSVYINGAPWPLGCVSLYRGKTLSLEDPNLCACTGV